jgi:hypothetical protein
MATQEIRLPQTWSERRVARRAGVGLALVAALGLGAVVGRSTVSTPQVREALRPATTLTDVGATSIGDLRRAEMFRAMNGILPAQLGVRSIGDLRRAEMFRAMNGILLAGTGVPSIGDLPRNQFDRAMALEQQT